MTSSIYLGRLVVLLLAAATMGTVEVGEVGTELREVGESGGHPCDRFMPASGGSSDGSEKGGSPPVSLSEYLMFVYSRVLAYRIRQRTVS